MADASLFTGEDDPLTETRRVRRRKDPSADPHPSLSLVLPLPRPSAWSNASSFPVSAPRSEHAVVSSLSVASAFSDGELRAGRHFNARLWDPVDCSRFMDDRPWSAVEAFVRECVAEGGGEGCGVERLGADATEGPTDLAPAGVCPGAGVLDGDRLEKYPLVKPGKTPRHTYKVGLSYYGPAFAGWAWMPSDRAYMERGEAWARGEVSVMATVQHALRGLFEGDKQRPIRSAGRTDKGVSGAGQCISFWTLNDLDPGDIERAIADSPPGKKGWLRVTETPARMPTQFHATFAATWRRYVYIMPLRQAGEEDGTPRGDVDPVAVDALLRQLEGKEVDMYPFARDTPPGKGAVCRFMVARAFKSTVPRRKTTEAEASHHAGGAGDDTSEHQLSRRRRQWRRQVEIAGAVDPDCEADTEVGRAEPRTTQRAVDDVDDDVDPVLVVELVADRFLRKLVRVLVATAVREAVAGAAADVLLALSEAQERTSTASPAPPQGLILAGVGYGNHPVWDEQGRAVGG